MRRSNDQTPPNNLKQVCVCGVLVLIAFAVIFVLSGPFEYGSGASRPILAVVGVLIAAAVAAFVGLGAAIKVEADQQRKLLLIILGLAISMRMVALFTCPILEIDYYRYLWDGKVLAEGISPYQYSPAQVLEATRGSTERRNEPSLRQLSLLAVDSEANHVILDRIHYENYTSIYPPVSQFVFAATMKWFPSSASVKLHIIGIRFVLVLFDIATLGLVYRLICIIKIHVGWSIAYAWNPLIIKEVANSGHLDSIAAFFLTLAVLAVLRTSLSDSTINKRRLGFWTPGCGGAALGLGVGAKLFPVVLFPALVVFIARQSWRKSSVFAVSFIIVASVSLWPMLPPSGNEVVAHQTTNQTTTVESGLPTTGDESLKPPIDQSHEVDNINGMVGFFSKWRMNDPVFSTIYLNLKNSNTADQPWFVVSTHDWRNRYCRWCQSHQFGNRDPAFATARILTLGMFAIFYLWQLMMIWRTDPIAVWKQTEEITRGHSWTALMSRLVAILAVFLVIQPTVNPWYFVWIFPLACLTTNRGWILVSGILMIYYSRFWFKTLEAPFVWGGFNYSGAALFDHIIVFVEFAVIAMTMVYFYHLKRNKYAR